MSKKNVAILTNFQEFNPGYSLCCIVVDQAHMLARYGHQVLIFVNEQFNPKHNKDSGLEAVIEKYPDKVFIIKKTKFMHLKDYNTKATLSDEHKKQAEEAGKIFYEELVQNNCTVVFTHDFVFTGWNLPYAIALQHCQVKIREQQMAKKWKDMRWYHWIHSVPSDSRDWWRLDSYTHDNFLVFPNKTEIVRVAESYKTNPNGVWIIPHIKDIRTWYDFSEETNAIIDKYPKLLQADIIQVYPCSSDRLGAKGLHYVMQIFGEMKKAQADVFLLIANQWATGRQNMESIGEYIKLATKNGLFYGDDFAFTSRFVGDSAMEYMYDRIDDAKTIQEFAAIYGAQTIEQLIEMDMSKLLKFDLKNITEDNFEQRKVDILQNMRPYALGVPRKVLRELQLLSNLLIFPTREESFGLVGPETAYSGALVVTNRSLKMMAEVMGHHTPSFDFGSHHMDHPPAATESYIKAVAHAILNRFFSNEAVMTKKYCRKRYNMDYLYNRYYAPILF